MFPRLIEWAQQVGQAADKGLTNMVNNGDIWKIYSDDAQHAQPRTHQL